MSPKWLDDPVIEQIPVTAKPKWEDDPIVGVVDAVPSRAQYLETPQEAGTRAKEAFELAVAENIPLDMATDLTSPSLPGLVTQLWQSPYHMGRRVIGGTFETGLLAVKGVIRSISDLPAVLAESPKARLMRHGSFGPNLLEQVGVLSPDMASWLRDTALPLIVDAMPEQMALAQTPGAFGARAVKILRNIGETGKADILEKMQTTVAETVRAKAKAIIEPYVMYLLGGKLIEEGVEGTKAYLGETPAESVAAVFTNPQLLAERVGGMIPYTVGTVALAIATEGTAAPFILTYLIEGEAAAQAAADRGASPAEQSDIGQIVGFINGAVEMWQVSKILEFVGGKAATKAFAGNASKAAVAKVAASSAAKSAWSKGVSVGVETVKLAVTEGGQETLQQATTETATCGITNEPLDPGFWERLILAGGLGAVASVITGGLFAGGQKALGIKAKTETAAPEAAAAPPVSAEAPVGAETPPAAAVAPAQPEDAKARKDAPLVELMAAEDALEMAFAAVRAAKPADLSAAKKSMVAAAVTWEAALARYTTWRDADVALAPAQPETVPEVGDETGVDRGMVVLPRGEPAAAERVVPAPEPGRDLMPAEPAAVEPSRWERGEESLAEKFSSGLYAGSVLEGGEVDPRADKGAWRSMGPKELQSILAGKMSGGAANAGKKGHYYSWFPSYSAAIKGKKGKPKFLVEFAGQASEDETTVTPVGRADISGVWVSEGGEWRKITPQALETEYGFSAPALARQEPTAAPAAATGFLSILTTEEQDEAERLKREIAHDMRSPQAVGGVPPFIGKAVRLAYLYAKAGVKTLADMTERLVADFGEGIRPHVAAIWNAMNQPVAAKAPETETTALMRAVLEEDAAAHGEEMPGRRPPVSLDEMVAQANAAFVADPFVGQRLVDELESTQRPSIPADRAILLHERTRLINEEKALTLQRTEAQQRNDTAALARIKVQSDRLAEQRRRLFDVATAGIRDPGLMLRFQQLFMAMDYTSAEDQIARIEVSQGRPATEAQKTKAREQAQKVADLNKQLEEANARAERWYKEALAAKAEKPAKPKAGEPARRTRAPVKPTIFTDEAAAAAVVRLRTKFRRVSAGIDPTIAADLLIIGGNTFERGARTFGRWAKQVLAELAELGPGAADAARPYLQDVWTTLQKRMAAEGKQDKAKVAYLKRTTARLTELEQKLAAGETEKPVKPPPRPLSEEELAVKEALDLVKWKMDQARMAPADRFWEGFRSVGRALRFPAGGDVSIPGRQTKPLLWNEIGGLLSFKPSKVWLTSTAKGWGAFFSRGKVLAMMEQLSADKPEAVAFAKEFVMWEELGRDPAKRPETGLSPFMERYMPLVRRGNEAAVAANNYAVVGAYELFAPRFRARGKLETPADRRALAKEIGKLTGRAVLPRGENVRRIAALLRDYAWSPRFWWAKITNVATLFGTLSLNPAVRAEGLRTLAGAVVYQTGMAALSMMLGGKFSLDPDDPDFMMAVFGNTKLDFTGGLRTPIRLAIRTAVSFFYDIMDGEAKGEDRGELILRHLKAQEGPLAGLITTIWTGKTFFGEEIHPPWSAEGWGDWTEEAKNRAMFMWLNDAYEVFRDELKNNGMTDAVFKAVAFGALSFSGENVQTYERKPKGKAPPFNPAEN